MVVTVELLPQLNGEKQIGLQLVFFLQKNVPELVKILVTFKSELFCTPSSTNLGSLPLISHELCKGLQVFLRSSLVLWEVLGVNVPSNLFLDGFEMVPIYRHFCEYK